MASKIKTNPFAGKSFGEVFKTIMMDYSYWVSFVLLLIVATAVNPGFFKWNNITNLFIQGSIIGVIALGMSLVIYAGQIDISVGAQAALVAGLSIEVLKYSNNIFLTLIFALAFGTILGTISGMLVAFGGMPAMVATLAMQSACRSIITQLGQGGPFTIKPDDGEKLYNNFSKIASGGLKLGKYRLPNLMIIFIIMAILFHFLMTRTKLGKHIYAVGSNERSARLAGVNIHLTKISVFSITGLMCGLGGFLLSSRLTAIQPSNAAIGYEMEAIAAVAIGGTAMSGGRGKIIGTFLGVLMFRMINNILVSADVPPFLNGLVSGVIIIIAVLMQNFQNKRK